MTLREDIVNGFARLMGVGSPVEKAAGKQPPPQAIQTSNELPASWLTSTYAPGWPIQPIERPEDVLIPREIDYPISVNATLQPRTAYGLMPFAALKEAYETVAEIRLPISTLLREMSVFRPHLVDESGGEILDHPFEWLTQSPDRVTSFDVWLSRFLKSSLIFDAGAFFYEYDHADLKGIRYVDGSTLFIVVDEHGQVPTPNQVSKDPAVLKKYQAQAAEWLRKGKVLPSTTPAYAQVIKGTPFGWYDSSQIWYKPRSRRYDAPYGETAIEQAWAWILICANISGFELAHYREGNMPEGWISAPEGWTLERLAAFETAFNQRMSAGASERMRARFLPNGMEWHETKKAEFPQALYNQAMEMISLFYGVPPSEYGKVPGQGLGGKGFEDAMSNSLFRMGLFPLKIFIEGAFNEVLERSGVTDAYFDLSFPTDETNPSKHKQSVIELFSNGLITFNGALAALGQDRIKGGDVHILLEYGSVQILEDILQHPEEAQPANPAFVPGKNVQPTQDEVSGNAKPPEEGDEPFTGGKGGKQPPKGGGGGNGSNGKNGNKPVDTQPTRKEKMTKADYELAERMLATRSLNPGAPFYSIPSVNIHGNDLEKGGAGSGNFSHSGRQGLRGGSGGVGVGGGGGFVKPKGWVTAGETLNGEPYYKIKSDVGAIKNLKSSSILYAHGGEHEGTILASEDAAIHEAMLFDFDNEDTESNWTRLTWSRKQQTIYADVNFAGENIEPEFAPASKIGRALSHIQSARHVLTAAGLDDIRWDILKETGDDEAIAFYERMGAADKLLKQGVDIPHVPAHPRDAKSRFASKGRLSDAAVVELLSAAGFETADVSMEDCYAMVDELLNVGLDDLELEKGGSGSGNFSHSGRQWIRGGSGGGGISGTVSMPKSFEYNDLDKKTVGLFSVLNNGKIITGTGYGNSHWEMLQDKGLTYNDVSTRGFVATLSDSGKKVTVVYDTGDGAPVVEFFENETRIGKMLDFTEAPTLYISTDAGAGAEIYKPEKLTKAAGDTGVMVALDVPDVIGRQLQEACKSLLPKDAEMLPVEEMHITLFYPGQMRKFEDELVEFTEAQLLDACKTFAKAHAPLTGVIGGVARFNADGGDKNPIVALFDCAELPQFRQDLVEFLHSVGIREGELDVNHGYIPHITLAYIPVDGSLKDEIKIDPLPITFKELSVVWGGKWHYVPLQAAVNIQKIQMGDLAKHCGVCEEDDDYYGAPIYRIAPLALVGIKQLEEMRDNEYVEMQPENYPPRIGVWYPAGNESDMLIARVGGELYPRAAAFYLLDRALNFYLAPVTYASMLDDEVGSVMHFTANAGAALNVGDYDPAWIEKAGVLDYIAGMSDARDFITHPDEPARPILVHNGATFPDVDLDYQSAFCDLMRGKQLSEDVLRLVRILLSDLATWTDIVNLVGEDAAGQAMKRATEVREYGMIPVPEYAGDEGEIVVDKPFSEEMLLAFRKGGAGSGNFGHSGRTGIVGGSGGGGAAGGGGGAALGATVASLINDKPWEQYKPGDPQRLVVMKEHLARMKAQVGRMKSTRQSGAGTYIGGNSSDFK